MTNTPSLRVFLKSASPMTCLCGAGLLIIASDRLAHAVTVAGALVWVYSLSVLAVHAGSRIFPRQGKKTLLVILASFVASFYMLLLWIMSPLCALSTFFALAFVPVICMASGIFERVESKSLTEKVLTSLSEALMLGLLIIIFALIREPIGHLSLSLPGGTQGIILLFSFNGESLLPIRSISSSSGALLLLGYILGLYHRYKTTSAPKGEQ